VVTLVVVKGFGKIPMMLLTTIPIRLKNSYDLERIFRIYRARWQCEEWIRFVKTAYQLEDIRCLNWRSIKNVVAFILFVNSMLTKRFGYGLQTAKSRARLLTQSRPIYFAKAKMTLYMLAEGMKEALHPIGVLYRSLVNEIETDIQMELPL
jgi:Lhr-like helicase